MTPGQKGKRFPIVHLLERGHNGTLSDYQQMARELRKTFRDASVCEIHLGKVRDSKGLDGYCVVVWSGHIPSGEYPGWTHIEGKLPEYRW